MSERQSHIEPYSMLVDGGLVEVVQAADVFYVEEFEDVVYAETEFPVWGSER